MLRLTRGLYDWKTPFWTPSLFESEVWGIVESERDPLRRGLIQGVFLLLYALMVFKGQHPDHNVFWERLSERISRIKKSEDPAALVAPVRLFLEWRSQVRVAIHLHRDLLIRSLRW
jgi:hypothetical protein